MRKEKHKKKEHLVNLARDSLKEALEIATEASFLSIAVAYDPAREYRQSSVASFVNAELGISPDIRVKITNTISNEMDKIMSEILSRMEVFVGSADGRGTLSKGQEIHALALKTGKNNDLENSLEIVKIFKTCMYKAYDEISRTMNAVYKGIIEDEEITTIINNSIIFLSSMLNIYAALLGIETERKVENKVNTDMKVHGVKVILKNENPSRYKNKLFDQLVNMTQVKREEWYDIDLNSHAAILFAIKTLAEKVKAEEYKDNEEIALSGLCHMHLYMVNYSEKALRPSIEGGSERDPSKGRDLAIDSIKNRKSYLSKEFLKKILPSHIK